MGYVSRHNFHEGGGGMDEELRRALLSTFAKVSSQMEETAKKLKTAKPGWVLGSCLFGRWLSRGLAALTLATQPFAGRL